MKKITPNKTRQALLDTGLMMIQDNGIRNFSIRGLTDRVKANPGSFVYHFGNREAFLEELLLHRYQPLIERLVFESQNSRSSYEKLHSMVMQLIDFIYDNELFLSQLILDALNGEKIALKLVSSTFDQHPQILIKAIKAAQGDNLIINGDPWEILSFIMAPVGFPVILLNGYKKNALIPEALIPPVEDFLFRKQRAVNCLNWALKGLSPEK